MRGEYPGEELSFSRPLTGTEIMTARRSPRYWRAFLEQFGICTPQPVNEGYSVNKYRHRNLECRSGTSLIFEPGETNLVEKMTSPGSFWTICIDPRLLEEAARGLGLRSRPHFKAVPMSDARLYRAITDFHIAVEQHASLLDVQCMFQTCLALLLDQYGEEAPPSPREKPVPCKLRRVKDFINDHSGEAVSLDELADAAELNRTYLCRTFKEHFGLPPNQYRHAVRISRAKGMLAEGKRPTEVAVEVGYGDSSHMLRFFRELVGVAPGQYRKLLLNERKTGGG